MGTLPSGCSFVPFTALGITSEGSRLLTCSLRVCKISFPAADMSAPESGRTLKSLEPFGEVMSTLTRGAGSLAVTFLMLEMVRCLTLALLVGGWVDVVR